MKLSHLNTHLNNCTDTPEACEQDYFVEFSSKQCSTVGAMAEAIPAQHTPQVTHMDRTVEIGGFIWVFTYLTFKWVRARARTNSEILMCCNHQRSHWSQCCKDAICGCKNYTQQFLQTWDALLSAAILLCASSTEYMLLFHYLPSFSNFPPNKRIDLRHIIFIIAYSGIFWHYEESNAIYIHCTPGDFLEFWRKSCNIY